MRGFLRASNVSGVDDIRIVLIDPSVLEGPFYTANFQSIKASASIDMIVPIAKCEFLLLPPRKRLSLRDQFVTGDNTTSAFDEEMCFYRLFLAAQQ